MKTSKKKPADARKPIAVSYVRFSRSEQRKGDSLRRQTEDSERWCERNGITLDSKLADQGRSAFHGRHRGDKAALGMFLEAVRAGSIPSGSYLIVENLDRLSREDTVPALHLTLGILMAGIRIVQLTPAEMVYDDKSEPFKIMQMIVELMRGNSESKAKSSRTLANWGEKLKKAREDKRAITRRLPGWVTADVKGGEMRLIPERAAVVRRIFELSAGGYGASSIVKKLTDEKVPAFGDREEEQTEGEGQPPRRKTRAKQGGKYGCGEWRTSYVRSILTDRRALGELQPRDLSGEPVGVPIVGYYPAAVDLDTFERSRTAGLGRRNSPGRIGKGVANLFGGLMKDARDGSSYYAAVKSDTSGVYRVLLNKGSIEGTARAYTFPYQVFERAVLSRLREVTPGEVLGDDDDAPADVRAVQSELDFIRAQINELKADLGRGYSRTIADLLREKEAREAELAGKVDLLRARDARPLSESWREARGLVDLLDRAGDGKREDLRLRLRSAIRRIVDEVWVLVVPRGRARLAAVQVRFTGGRHRDYIVYHRPAHGGPQGRTEGGPPLCRDFLDLDGLDLRRKDHAKRLEKVLLRIDI